MNAEIAKIRGLRGQSEIINREPTRIKEEEMNDLIFQLNTNMGDLYSAQTSDNIDIELFARKFIDNIYIILNMFNTMGIYPDYFYDQIAKMNIEYKTVVQNNNSIRGNYRLFNKINLSARVIEAIRNGYEKGYYRVQAYQKKDLNDAFVEMLGFFQAFNIPYNIHTDEQCRKTFNDIKFNHLNIIEELLNSDFLLEDIECLSRLLFEYMTFFVSMGIYPKKYMEEKIEDESEKKHK